MNTPPPQDENGTDQPRPRTFAQGLGAGVVIGVVLTGLAAGPGDIDHIKPVPATIGGRVYNVVQLPNDGCAGLPSTAPGIATVNVTVYGDVDGDEVLSPNESASAQTDAAGEFSVAITSTGGIYTVLVDQSMIGDAAYCDFDDRMAYGSPSTPNSARVDLGSSWPFQPTSLAKTGVIFGYGFPINAGEAPQNPAGQP